MLSGIGDKNVLDKVGIQTLHNLPGVGKNLQDHCDVIINVKTKTKTHLSYSLLNLPKQIYSGYEYLTNRTGIFTSTIAEAGGFVKSAADVEIPDI